MIEHRRPDPDELLSKIQAGEVLNSRGKLKIFLGYAAGVGKTYAMLEAAHQRKNQDINVIVGYIETHKRKETEGMLAGLDIIPRRETVYHGTTLTEMDLDAILQRQPQLVLVDELAHTNVPESRHPKRYQDVEEILAAGIDVYTTLNIQHFESMNDVVRQITGVTVRETVPDSIIDQANEIEVIDLPPDELMQRLKEGKVYIPDQAARAIEKFFRKGNLTALREISLRRAAGRVDTQMRSYMRAESIAGPWPAGEHILVSISSHPMGERLIRTGRRLADDLKAEWIVVVVETPGYAHMPAENRERMAHNLALAEQLGARVETLTGTSVSDTILEFARTNNITKIIAGKPLRPRWFEILRGGSVVDQIIRSSGSIDVYVISEESSKPVSLPEPRKLFKRQWGRYLISIGMVVLVTLLSTLVYGKLESTNLVMFFLAVVVISAVYLGRGPSILASILSVVAFDFFLVQPRFSFAVTDTEYIVTFIALLAVGLIISTSASLLRDQVDQLRKREINARAINSLSKELNAAVNLSEVLDVVIKKLGQTFECSVVILLPNGHGSNLRSASGSLELDNNEQAVALWAYQNCHPAGQGTDTLPAGQTKFLPLKTSNGIVGVLGIKSQGKNCLLTHDDQLLLENFVNLGALAMERALFAEQANQAESLRTTERLQSALLNSISHELRTPLASIMGALTSLEDNEAGREMPLNQETRVELIKSAASQTSQLNHLVGNLLDMTRLQSGTVKLHRTPVDVQDLIGAVLNQMESRRRGHKVNVEIPDSLQMVSADAVLIGQTLINLLDNAIKFSPNDSAISIKASANKKEIHLSVLDEGPGVPGEELKRIFEKFYRGSTATGFGGTGLGLSICRGIVEAHGGRIWAENIQSGGFKVEFTLPLNVPSDS